MPKPKRRYLNASFLCNFCQILFVLCVLLLSAAKAQELKISEDDLLILEPIIQKYTDQDYAYVYNLDDKSYISLSQMSSFVGYDYKIENNNIKIYWGLSPNKIDINIPTQTVIVDGQSIKLEKDDIIYVEDTYFASNNFYSKFLNINITVNFLDMQLTIDGKQMFPTTIKRQAEQKRNKGLYQFEKEPVSNYDFDNRLYAAPVVDLSFGRGLSHAKRGGTKSTDNYSANVALIAAGLDINAYIYGDSYNNRKPQMRIKGSREFVDDPPNALNVKKFEIGDISSMNYSYFTSGGSGRGISLSSFKNMVTNADKTIDITGTILDGWEVELYWNNQLVGYRQSGIAGEYKFENLPVSYGLNEFKLIFYGPYGETREEIRRYYSGISPVAKGEFGYNFSLYQPERYLYEKNEPPSYLERNTKSTLDFSGYYGISDIVTAMFGYTQTPSLKDFITQNFAMTGIQYSIDGVTLQYNLERNLDNKKLGHHWEVQGDIYIGTIYAAIDQYNKIHSPISYQGTTYLKDQYTMRLSGMLPANIPYYISYREGSYEDKSGKFNEFSTRLSKQMPGNWNLSLENNYYKLSNSTYNDIRLGGYKWWGILSSEAWITHQLKPTNELKEIKLRGDVRLGRRTYISTEYTHNLIEDMDYLSVSAGHVFSFGGLTATLQTDRDLNFSAYLTYNISFAKVPTQSKFIATGNSRFSDTGSIYVNLEDENGQPLEGVALDANGLEKPIYTDEHGGAVLTDLQTYERTIIKIDEETLPDIALVPENQEKKVLLRPGTVRKVTIPFVHKGALEGKLENEDGRILFGYKISAFDAAEKEIKSTFSDTEGYFILDGLPYGQYSIKVTRDGKEIFEKNNINIDDIYIYLEDAIPIKKGNSPPQTDI